MDKYIYTSCVAQGRQQVGADAACYKADRAQSAKEADGNAPHG